jgi:hypothetical protein
LQPERAGYIGVTLIRPVQVWPATGFTAAPTLPLKRPRVWTAGRRNGGTQGEVVLIVDPANANQK